MSNTITDYSNTIIYTITCKDQTITDVYVGHTVNFVQRKHAHKQSCVNTKCVNYKCKLYEVIRNNGGWDNWKMEIVDFFNCCNQFEARQKEQEYFISLNATLNSIEPNPPPKPIEVKVKKIKIIQTKTILVCESCKFKTSNENYYNRHLMTANHNKNINCMKIQNVPIKTSLYEDTDCQKFHCDICDYNTSRHSQYSRHMLTTKHKNNHLATQPGQIVPLKKYECVCSKIYNDRAGLWRHKKKCSQLTIQPVEHVLENTLTPPVSDVPLPAFDMNLVLELFKQNQEIKDMIIDQNEKILEFSKQHQL